MNCPNCKSKNVYVLNSYSAGCAGNTQRRRCSSCETIITTTVVVLNVNPSQGEGAYATAQRMRKEAEGD